MASMARAAFEPSLRVAQHLWLAVAFEKKEENVAK
jgi:hypothetical protein